MSETEMIEGFIDQKTSEEEQLTLDFAKQILEYQLQQKTIGGFIKDSKKDAKSMGILVGDVMRVIKELKEEFKSTDLEKTEKEFLKDKFRDDFDIKFKIQQLVEKD
jgi:hypothetical protein